MSNAIQYEYKKEYLAVSAPTKYNSENLRTEEMVLNMGPQQGVE